MTKDDLINELNAYCAERGFPLVEPRMIRRWIDDRLIPKSKPRGRKRGVNPLWELPVTALRRAKKIVNYRAQNLSRHTQLILALWFEGEHYQEDQIRSALLSELARMQKRSHRKIIPPARYVEPSGVGEGCPPNSLMPETLKRPFEALVMRGAEDNALASRAIAAHLRRIFPDQLFPADEIATINLKEMEYWPIIMAGLLGSPDEIGDSAHDDINQCEWDDLRCSRFLMTRLISRALAGIKSSKGKAILSEIHIDTPLEQLPDISADFRMRVLVFCAVLRCVTSQQQSSAD